MIGLVVSMVGAVAFAGSASDALATAPVPATVDLGWDGLILEDEDARAEVHLLARGGTVVSPSRPVSETAVGTFRPLVYIEGAGGRVGFLSQLELGTDPHLLDARVDLHAGEAVTVHVGQFVVPLNRSWLTPLPLLSATDRPLSTATFAPGRRAGGDVHLQTRDHKLEVWGGAFSPGAPGEPATAVHAPAMVARAQLNPAGVSVTDELAAAEGTVPAALSIGAGAWHTGGLDADPSDLTLTGDLAVQLAAFHAVAEVFEEGASSPEVPDRWGASLQGSAMGPARKALVGARMAAVQTLGSVPTLAEAGWVTALVRDSHATCTLRLDRAMQADGVVHPTVSVLGQVRM